MKEQEALVREQEAIWAAWVKAMKEPIAGINEEDSYGDGSE